MSVDLETQLRSYRRNFDSESPAVDPLGRTDQPVVRPGMRSTTQRGWHIRRGLVTAFATALLVLIVVGGVGLIPGPVVTEPDPAVRKNGWIAFGEGGDIWLVDLGKKSRRVVGTDADSVDELCPAFSPDGRRLAFGRLEGQSAALAVADMDTDGHVSDPVIIEVGDGLPPPCPVWSPDSSQIAFGIDLTDPFNPTTSGAGSEVWIVTLSDNEVTVLPDLLAADLEWSPDGSVLAIVPGTMLDAGRIYLYESASGTMRSIDTTLAAASLTWSPDGGQIAYEGGTGGTVELRVIDVETEQQQMLASYGHAGYGIGPVWSPDGGWILYQRCAGVGGGWCGFSSQEVVLVSVSDSKDGVETAGEVIIHSSIETADGACRLVPRWVTWSPDGRYLLHAGESHMSSVSAHPGSCGNLTFLATIPIDLQVIRSARMMAEGKREVDLAAAKLTEPNSGDFDGPYYWGPEHFVTQTWGVRASDQGE